MLRMLGLMPSLEPSAQELAEARILEQTGYTSETIEGFKQTIREREAQLLAVEESLTKRILQLQAERDEALLGITVAKGELPRVSPDDALAAAQHRGTESHDQAFQRDQQRQEDAAYYEKQVDTMQREIGYLRAELQRRPAAAGAGAESNDDDGPSLSQLTVASPVAPPPAGGYPSYTSPALESTASVVRDLSKRLSDTQAELELAREDLEQERQAKEAMEKHLAGVLASPAVSKVSSPNKQFQFDAEHTAQSSEDNANEEVVRVQAELHALRRQLEQQAQDASAKDAQQQTASASFAEERAQLQSYCSQLQADLYHAQQQASQQQHHQQQQQQQANGGDSEALFQLQQHYAQLQQEYHQTQHASQSKDSELSRLQSELLRLQSIDHQPASPSQDSGVGAASSAALQQQVATLQQQLSWQASQAAEDKQRMHATLQEKLAAVKQIITSKDEAIRKLKTQLQQLKQQSPPHQQQPLQYHVQP